jgi:hypothetical protein
MLLSGSRNALNGREVKGTRLHPGKNEIECLNPHGNWCINLVVFLVLVDSHMHTIVGDVFVKDDGFLVNWFEFGGHGNACSGCQIKTELTLVRGFYTSNQRRRGRTRCMLRASSELGQHGVEDCWGYSMESMQQREA